MTREQQIKIQRCIDDFYSNRPQVRDELGAALQVLYEAEPVKHGRWKKLYRGNYECSLCGDWWTFSVPNTEIVQAFKYCPHCGARMDGGENGI